MIHKNLSRVALLLLATFSFFSLFMSYSHTSATAQEKGAKIKNRFVQPPAPAKEASPEELQFENIRYIRPRPRESRSAAVIVEGGALAWTAYLLPTDNQGKIADPSEPLVQVEQLILNLTLALSAADTDLKHLVKLNLYARDIAVANFFLKHLAENTEGDVLPAVTIIRGKPAHPQALLALDAAAATDAGQIDKPVSYETTDHLFFSHPQLSHVAIVQAGPKAFISGQAEKGDLTTSVKKTLESLERSLKYLGLSWEYAAQMRVFITPIADKNEAEQAIVKFFEQKEIPPVSYVEWESTLPVEIELVAAARQAPLNEHRAVQFLTPTGMSASPLFSRVTKTSSEKLIFIGGLSGDPKESADKQVKNVLEDLKRLAATCGSDMEHLLKATYLVTDDKTSTALNDWRPRYFQPTRPPAASKALVSGVELEGSGLLLDMIAVPKKKR